MKEYKPKQEKLHLHFASPVGSTCSYKGAFFCPLLLGLDSLGGAIGRGTYWYSAGHGVEGGAGFHGQTLLYCCFGDEVLHNKIAVHREIGSYELLEIRNNRRISL